MRNLRYYDGGERMAAREKFADEENFKFYMKKWKKDGVFKEKVDDEGKAEG